MANRRGICGSNKTRLINPNLLFGEGLGQGDDNISVSLEDLNIYVELTTSKKNRSIIDITDNGLEYTSQEKGKAKVSFIDGSLNGKTEVDLNGNIVDGKSLTTSYTDLTTVFNKTADTEKFGMTSIDIDFNSAYAPLVHIEFVDIRGASLFNSGNPPKSEYSSFFDLPYPIFELKVKGYYGKIVKYCLHLTKWNARFNSKTGNFEISADFIGYTYAMFSDLLLGYLKAITYTKMGAQKFELAKQEMKNPAELITIKEFLDKIVLVNEEIGKISNDDTDAKELSVNKEIQSSVDNINNLLKDFINTIITPNTSSESNAVLDVGDRLIGVRNSFNDIEKTKQIQLDLSTWKDAMKTQINQLNDNIESGSKYYINDFVGDDAPLYYEKFNYNNILSDDNLQNNFRESWKLTDNDKFQEFIEKLYKLPDSDKDVNISLYDFSKTIKTINTLKANIEKSEEKSKTAISLKIKDIFINILGFEPTIGSIFRIFTVHAEIFLECLKEVSEKAESDVDKLRIKQLEGLKDKFDIHQSTSTSNGNLPPKIYPWPLFRKTSKDINKTNTFEEAYLGDTIDGGVKIPQNVPELVFVDDLLVALIETAKDDNERQDRIDNPDTIINSWYPVNVLDTPLFGVIQNPYKTPSIGSDSSNQLDPLKLMLMRAFTFLGLSNRDFYDTAEIQLMATLEANTCSEGIINPAIRSAMITGDDDNVSADNIIKTFLNGTNGTRNVSIKYGEDKKENIPTPLFRKINNSDKYDYTYYPSINLGRILPRIAFNGDFDSGKFLNENGKILTNNEILENSIIKINDGVLFIEPHDIFKNDDIKEESGAIFIKIFTDEQYDDTKGLIPEYVQQSDEIQQLKSILVNQGNYLDTSDLYNKSRDEEFPIKGFNIFGTDGLSKYSFTTIKELEATLLETSPTNFDTLVNNTLEVIDELEPIKPPKYSGGVILAKSNFYIAQGTNFGATSLSKPPIKQIRELSNTHKGEDKKIKNITFNKIRYGFGRSFDTDNSYYPDLGKNIELFNKEDVIIPHVDFIVVDTKKSGNLDNVDTTTVYSLFGSQLYFEQRRSSSPKSAKALLFLHTLPWNQLYTTNSGSDGKNGSIFDNSEGNTISNLFNRKSAFINAPYLWCAFIGGILWRNDTNTIIFEDGNPSYEGGSGKLDPIVWGEEFISINNKKFIDINSSFISAYNDSYKNELIPLDTFPMRNQYLTSTDAISPLQLDTNGKYKFIDDILINLPVQAKKEFKKIFFDFVNGLDWESIRNNYEIHPVDWELKNGDWSIGTNKWKNKWNSISYLNYQSTPIEEDNLEWGGNKTGIYGIKSLSINLFRNLENYDYIEPIRTSYPKEANKTINIKYNYDMALRDNENNQKLVRLFKKGVWIANSSYKTWLSEDATSQKDYINQIVVSVEHLKLYVKSFCKEWKKLLKLNLDKKENDEIKQQLFNSMDNNTIRLNIYRHCKSIYDKWIAGSSGNFVAACGKSKNTKPKKVDLAINQLKKKPNSPIRLIDSFRFVNRGFNDLSDTFLINPSAITNIMQDNPNQSFYDLISRLLGDNNFNFIALPTYIDFHSEKEMLALFKPEIFSDELDEDISGPTFVCVYIGQSSNKLDLGNTSQFPNDGFDFRCDSNGNLEVGEGKLPMDFTKTGATHEHNVIAIDVNYGHQNQNIFTDIRLDQQEFSETDESLQITDSIANNGQSNATLAGQNLWNVYQVRSYSATIEAMGNAMIQPMMYFQLNNIPMFHGAYLIINTKHSIIPNYMTTTFKGVRTRWVDTPQIDSQALYMSMLGTLSDVDGTSTKISRNGSSLSNIAQRYGSFVTYKVNSNNGLIYQLPNELDSYAIDEVGKFMQGLGTKWVNTDNKTKFPLNIRAFGKYNGGSVTTHSSNSKHYAGLAVDFRPMLKRNIQEKWNVGESNYSREKNKELFKMAIELSNNNTYGVQLEEIILNDVELINELRSIGASANPPINIFVTRDKKTGALVDHNNHIHFTFYPPNRVEQAIAKGENGTDQQITTEGVAGTKSKEPLPETSRLNKTEMKQHLGKI